MNINDNKPLESVPIFEDLEAGDVFRYSDDELYIKTVDADGINAVALADGDVYMIPRKAEIRLVKGAFVVE